ncbi:hypothetical protein [Dokdonella soli]|uniref:Uncharacterized protein n=1 Tax=Dokdonella soli TaxID=529810 RepID=A0ABN1IE52_9GAMM
MKLGIVGILVLQAALLASVHAQGTGADVAVSIGVGPGLASWIREWRIANGLDRKPGPDTALAQRSAGDFAVHCHRAGGEAEVTQSELTCF